MDSEPFLSLTPRDHHLSESLSRDIELLDGLLGQVLQEHGEEDLLNWARRLSMGGEATLDVTDSPSHLESAGKTVQLLRAFTVLFQLVNQAEQKEIVRVNRGRGRQGQTARPESVQDAILHLKSSGLSAEEVQALIDRIDISPTLTAHPTEARRRAVLDKLKNIALELANLDEPIDSSRLDLPLALEGRARQEIYLTLLELWETEELRSYSLTVGNEVQNSLYFLQSTILDVVPSLQEDLRQALREAYPDFAFTLHPLIRYRSWVGGDRDGNPNVTPDTTWKTLLEHRRHILSYYLEQVDLLQGEFTQSSQIVSISDALRDSMERDRELTSLPPEVLSRIQNEPYRLKLFFIQKKLQETLAHLDDLNDFRMQVSFSESQPPAYARSGEFLNDLLLMQSSLEASHGRRLAHEGKFARLIAQVQSFGFHFATLDIRQHSEEHERVIDEMLAAAGLLGGRSYASWTEEEKVEFLTQELAHPRPLLPRDWDGSPEVIRMLQVFEVIRHAQRHLSPQAVTTYIISMTHGISDILEVLLLAKEAGLFRRQGTEDRKLESRIDVVPLFETIDDLHDSSGLMAQLFDNPVYREQLEARGGFQEIMLGYSDSNKDGGYLAANWALQQTQETLAGVCRDAGITLQLFHGRGGTVGRGGGRANRAILSQPSKSFNGRIRFTEQGEVISFRYNLLPIAHRHLEQIVNAVFLAAAELPGQKAIPDDWRAAMDQLAADSRTAFRRLVYDDPDFWDFYTQATPIAHISRLPIASRPVYRPGNQSVGLQDLRAIPWNFAWVQSRYVVPGWYGVGAALEACAAQGSDALDRLRAMYREWPFFRTVLDNAQLELIRAHLPTAALYASRVQPKELGQRFHRQIEEEYERTCHWMLQVTEQAELMERSPIIRRTVELRNPMVMPLNRLQVELMEKWDQLSSDGNPGEEGNEWRDALSLSIIGIASAMQSTG